MSLCKIQCSGGCENCAPDETSFFEWWNEDTSHIDIFRTAQVAWQTAWHQSRKYYEKEVKET